MEDVHYSISYLRRSLFFSLLWALRSQRAVRSISKSHHRTFSFFAPLFLHARALDIRLKYLKSHQRATQMVMENSMSSRSSLAAIDYDLSQGSLIPAKATSAIHIRLEHIQDLPCSARDHADRSQQSKHHWDPSLTIDRACTT